MDQFHLVKNYNEGRLLSEVHEAVSGWLEQHRTAMWDSMEPTDKQTGSLTHRWTSRISSSYNQLEIHGW